MTIAVSFVCSLYYVCCFPRAVCFVILLLPINLDKKWCSERHDNSVLCIIDSFFKLNSVALKGHYLSKEKIDLHSVTKLHQTTGN